jgi:phage head maturation protease
MPPRNKQTFVSPSFATKVEAEQGIVEAIVNVFGILDDGGDIVVNGAFAKTLTERGRKLRVLNSHNSGNVLSVVGKVLDIREVGREELPAEILAQYPEATGGLWTRTQYLLETPEGKGVFDRIKAGALDESSIGYEAIQTEYKKVAWRGKETTARMLKEIRLWEYSPVVWGMNPATVVTGVKADDDKEMTSNGPVARIGDKIEGMLRQQCSGYASRLLAMGQIGREDVRALNVALDAAMDAFTAALPENLSLTPVSMWDSFYFDQADQPEGQKLLPLVPEPEEKAGRVLSASNASRVKASVELIESAVENLKSLLQDAGVIEQEPEEGTTPEEDETPPDDQPKSEEPLAEPEIEPPLTDEARNALLALVTQALEAAS